MKWLLHQVLLPYGQPLFNALFDFKERMCRRVIDKDLLNRATFIAHRGVFGHETILENSLEAFDLALSHGVGIEFDIRLSADDVVMVHHDASLLRVHGCQEAIAELSYQEIQMRAPAVPTLEDVFQRYHQRCPQMMIEAKRLQSSSAEKICVEKTCALIEKYQLQKKVVIISFDHDLLLQFGARLPQLPLSGLFLMSPVGWDAFLNQHPHIGLMGWYFTFPEVIRRRLAKDHAPLGVGFFNHPYAIFRYVNAHFRYIFSDRIDRVMPKVKQLSQR